LQQDEDDKNDDNAGCRERMKQWEIALQAQGARSAGVFHRTGVKVPEPWDSGLNLCPAHPAFQFLT
jgi:hypothetical protein